MPEIFFFKTTIIRRYATAMLYAYFYFIRHDIKIMCMWVLRFNKIIFTASSRYFNKIDYCFLQYVSENNIITITAVWCHCLDLFLSANWFIHYCFCIVIVNVGIVIKANNIMGSSDPDSENHWPKKVFTTYAQVTCQGLHCSISDNNKNL